MKTTDDLQSELSAFEKTKLFKSIAGWVGAGLYLSGVFLSLSGSLSEMSEDSIAEEFGRTSSYYNEDLYLKNNIIKSKDTEFGSDDVVAGYVTFDTSGSVNILDSNGCSSLTDNGTANYTINFAEPLGDYIYTFITSEPVNVIKATIKSGSLNLIFDKPLSGIIQVLFFEKVLTVG